MDPTILQLPDELLEMIIEKIDSVPYRMLCRAVCKRLRNVYDARWDVDPTMNRLSYKEVESLSDSTYANTILAIAGKNDTYQLGSERNTKIRRLDLSAISKPRGRYNDYDTWGVLKSIMGYVESLVLCNLCNRYDDSLINDEKWILTNLTYQKAYKLPNLTDIHQLRVINDDKNCRYRCGVYNGPNLEKLSFRGYITAKRLPRCTIIEEYSSDYDCAIPSLRLSRSSYVVCYGCRFVEAENVQKLTMYSHADIGAMCISAKNIGWMAIHINHHRDVYIDVENCDNISLYYKGQLINNLEVITYNTSTNTHESTKLRILLTCNMRKGSGYYCEVVLDDEAIFSIHPN